MAKKEIIYTLVLPSEVSATYTNKILTIKSQKAELKKSMKNYRANIKVEGNKIIIEGKPITRRTRDIVKTAISHIQNMVEGAIYGYKYKLKIVYSHFPMTAQIEKDTVLVKNFLGEKYPRKSKIRGATKVEVKGAEIIVSGYDKEEVSQTASSIEQSAKVKNKDIRRYQDGVYLVEQTNITEKPNTKVVEVIRGRE
ncbi:MAG TPA: 50S ribosomal protein L6 [archaeon]|nr:50S ribosomal protein L6 [archaeon]